MQDPGFRSCQNDGELKLSVPFVRQESHVHQNDVP